MMNAMNTLSFSGTQNGVARRGRKPRTVDVAVAKPRAQRGQVRRPSAVHFRALLTGAMGCGIPLLSLSLSTIAGTLARTGHDNLALASVCLTACVLAVSLSHLAWAVRDITGSPWAASWALAVAFDLALVLGETVHVYADDSGLAALVTAVMVAVCGLSMVLNCWAFFKHPTK
jgi:hypothetical protein